MAEENAVENSWTVTIVGNGVGAAAGVIANEIAAASASNPTIAAGLAFTKMSILSAASETLTVGIAIQSGDPNRIGSASTAAIGALAGSLIAAALVGAASAGVVIVSVGVGGLLGTQIGKEAWDYLTGQTQLDSWFTDALNSSGNTFLNLFLPEGLRPIDIGTSTFFTSAQRFVPRKDPLTFDLDGDGLETVGTAAGILFDHDGDGVKTGTGWVAADDAFLVLDRNGNGVIDDGRELFGDSTIKSNGQPAADGFDALADLDSNADGQISSADAQFSSLHLWRDLNQDGISQSGELFTLNDLGIASINVASSDHSKMLPNGNQIADLGTYTRTDGSTGATGTTSTLGDINLAADTFHRQFTDTLDTSSVASLPDMQGSGVVRNLQEATNDGNWRAVA